MKHELGADAEFELQIDYALRFEVSTEILLIEKIVARRLLLGADIDAIIGVRIAVVLASGHEMG